MAQAKSGGTPHAKNAGAKSAGTKNGRARTGAKTTGRTTARRTETKGAAAPARETAAAPAAPRKEPRPAWAEALVIVLVWLAFSLLFLSNLTQRYSQSDYPAAEADLSQLSSQCTAGAGWTNGISYTGGTLTIPADGGDVCLPNLDMPTRAVSVTTAPASDSTYYSGRGGVMVTITATISDEANEPGSAQADTLGVNPLGKRTGGTLLARSNGNASYIKLSFSKPTQSTDYAVTRIVVNPPWSFHMAWGTALLLLAIALGVWALRRTGAWRLTMDWSRGTHNALYWGSAGLAVLILLIISLWVYSPAHIYQTKWSAGNVQDQYIAQADAWRHHHAALSDTPDASLESLDNPYSRSARDASGADSLWDVSYYNGKYYSYFGITPILLAYLPVRQVMGMYPTAIHASTILAILAVAALAAALREMLVTFKVRSNLVLTALMPLALSAGSLVFLNQASAAVYNMALLAALANGAAFVAAGFRAVRSKGMTRAVMFILAGLCLGFQFMSRPNSLLVTIPFMAPLFIGVLRDPKREGSAKARDAAWFTVPALAVAIVQLVYNAKRFSGPFDFGTAYQITVADMRTSSAAFNPLKVKDMILDYWFMPPKVTADFPWVDMQSYAVESGYGNYAYVHWMVGLLWLPLVWFLFAALSRRAQRSIGLTARIMAWCALIGGVVLMYVNYAMAGAIFRYYCDALWVFQLVAALAMLARVRPASDEEGGEAKAPALYLPAVLALGATIVVGLLLIFASNRQTPVISELNPDAFLALASFFD